MMKMRLLIINKAVSANSDLWRLLSEAGFEPVEAASAGQTLKMLRDERYDFIIANPKELLQDRLSLEIRRLLPLSQITALTTDADLLEMMECLTSGCADYLADAPENYPVLLDALVAAGHKIRRWRAAFGIV